MLKDVFTVAVVYWSDEAKLALVLEGVSCDGIWERRGVASHILFLSLLFNDISC